MGAGLRRTPRIGGIAEGLLLPPATAFGLAVDDAIGFAVVLPCAPAKLGVPPRIGQPSRRFVWIGHGSQTPTLEYQTKLCYTLSARLRLISARKFAVLVHRGA